MKDSYEIQMQFSLILNKNINNSSYRCYFAIGQASAQTISLTFATPCEIHMVFLTLWMSFYLPIFILVPSKFVSLGGFLTFFLISPNLNTGFVGVPKYFLIEWGT